MSLKKLASSQTSVAQGQSASGLSKIQLPFAADTASFNREGNTLSITAENGEAINVENFFVVEPGKSLPMLVLQDGSEVNSADYLSAMNPDLDITTAAGQSSAAQGSGVNDYSDQAGDLIGGVDRLGSLGTFQWDRTTETDNLPIWEGLHLSGRDGALGTPGMPGDNYGRDDDLIVLEAKDLNNVFVHGDSPFTSDLTGNVLLPTTSGSDTLTLGDRGNDITDNSVVGGVVDRPEVWGYDTITITADTVKNSTISGGKGHDILTIDAGRLTNTYISGDEINLISANGFAGDTITIKGDVSGSSIGGDAGYDMVNSTGGSGDSISITGEVLGGWWFNTDFPSIGGDAGYDMTNSTGGASDSISITAGEISDSYVGGDAGRDMTGSIGGANDSIRITMSSSGSSVFDSSIGGDAGRDMTGSTGGSGDSISITGAIVSLGRIVSSIGGDAGRNMTNSTGGDNDSITITGAVAYCSSIGGDAGRDMTNSKGGSFDSISITGKIYGEFEVGFPSIGGDAGENMTNSTGGASDSITITGSVSKATIGGDAGRDMRDNSTGGASDSISIVGDVSGYSYIGGDAGRNMTANSTGGASDSISIVGDVSLHSHVGGDAGENMTNSTGGSGDSITITGTVSGYSYIGGDAGKSMTNSSGGDDYITINTLNGGFVSGDAYEMKNSTGGNDYININVMQGGAVYGDGGKTSGTHTGGNDTISIGLLEGTASKIIGGGAGNDLFIYNNTSGHSITLQDNGKVTIVDANDTDITATTNTNITGFEGIGGGSGNDILVGNSHDNLIIGGAGNDILTGGAGADTFAWGQGHEGTVDNPAFDIITDFNIAEGDVIDLSALLKGYGSGNTNISDYLNITNDGTNTTLTISSSGTGAIDQVIQLQGVSDLSADDILANILLTGGM